VISATVEVTYPGCPIAAPHADSSMSTTNGGHTPFNANVSNLGKATGYAFRI